MSRKKWGILLLPWMGLGLSLVLVAAAILAWLPLASGHDFPAYVPLSADKSLGINADLSLMEPEEREEALTVMETSGFRWLRQRFAWDAIEPENGAFDWTAWDDIVDEVNRHNLGLIAVLDGSPAWARAAEDAGNRLAPPAESRDFGDFAEEFATRYGDRIDHYQIWDEPNIAPHWGAGEIHPAGYVRLLREGAIRIRKADPGAVILAAALAPNVEPGGANMSDLLFLDQLYQHGAAEWFDVVAAQLYDFGEPPEAPADSSRLNWNRAALLRDVVESQGDGGTAVWAVSFGSDGMGAETVAGLMEQTRKGFAWLGPMVWAAWSPDDAHGQYALIGADGQPGSVYDVLVESATALPVAWPGTYPADHGSGSYEGDWRVTPSGADIGASGDRLVIRFQGTRLDLTVRRGDYRAFLFVTVDGQPANSLPRDDEGRSYLVLYDPLGDMATITLAQGLPNGKHTAEITAERGWGQWAIAGWTVSQEGPRRLAWLPTVLGLAAVAVLGVTTCTAWVNREPLRASCCMLIARYRALDTWLVLIITGTAAILVYVMPGTVPTLMALALLGVLLLLRPEAGLPLIALALPFYQPGVELLGKVFSLVEILTLVTAACWVVNRVLRMGHWGLPNPHSVARSLPLGRLTALDWGVVALVIVGAFSLLWAEQGRVAAREFRTVVLGAGIFYGLLRTMVQELDRAWHVADAWVLGATLIALVGIVQWTFGQNLITAEGVWRVRGFYGSPNNLALYLGRVFPLVIAVAVFSMGDKQEAVLTGRRWFYGIAALVMGVALFLTYSRGAWLLGVPASLLFLAAMRGWRTLAVALVVLIVVAVAGGLLVGTERLTSLLNTTEGTTFFRLQLWQSSWAMIQDHPILGVGLDNFLYAYRSRYVLPTAWEEFNLSHPHNLVLDFWIRLGLPGLMAMVWLLVFFFRQGWREYRRLQGSDTQLLVLGLMAGVVSFVAHGLVDNAFFLVDLAFAFMIMVALVQATKDEGAKAGDQHPVYAAR